MSGTDVTLADSGNRSLQMEGTLMTEKPNSEVHGNIPDDDSDQPS